MKTVTFYAIPQELLGWVEEWRLKFGLHTGVVAFRPRFQLSPLEVGERLDSVWHPQAAEERRFDEIWLNLEPMDRAGMTSSEIRRNNQDRLEVAIPRITASTIEQSDIGTVSQEREHLRTWKKIVADLKRKTNAGMWVVGGTGIKGFAKDKLYSAGIADAVKQGMRLTNLTGLEVFIDEPHIESKPTPTN